MQTDDLEDPYKCSSPDISQGFVWGYCLCVCGGGGGGGQLFYLGILFCGGDSD